MDKVIKISDKEYKMSASALTQFTYKDETGRSFLQDIKSLIKLANKEITIDDIEILDDINNLVLPLAYIMIKEADSSQVSDYKSFLKSISNLYDNFTWVEEVILLGCSPISRQLQNN